MANLYSLKNIDLSYRIITQITGDRIEIRALNNLSLDIQAGEFLVILGANGSGKSSLGKLMAGLVESYSGEIAYRGEKVKPYSRDIFRDVTMVLQEPQNQLLMPSVAKELAYPLENRGISSDEIGQRVTEYSRMFALEDILEKGPDELSGGQITSLAIASALITDPSVIILDEPDSHFDKTRETTLLDFIDTYRGRKTIILITQYLQYASKAVRVAIMKEGAVVKQGLPDEILGDETLLVRANLIPDQKALKVAKAPARHMESKSLITLESINYSYPGQAVALTDLSFEIRAGQKVGIYGEIGSGKTTLGLIMSGLILPQSGHVSLKGKPIDQYDENSLRQVITMSMQFPERAMFEQSVADDIACGPKNLGKNDVETLVERQIGKFQLDNLRDRHLFTLSGGEKRKAALAGILAMDTEIVILDEPTAALDPRSCRDLAEIIWDSNDMTFIIISHDRDFLKTTCNRFIEMHQGEIKSDKDIL